MRLCGWGNFCRISFKAFEGAPTLEGGTGATNRNENSIGARVFGALHGGDNRGGRIHRFTVGGAEASSFG